MLQPGSTVGRYVVERKIGHGGMAVVHLVRDELGAPWALKLLTMGSTEVRKRFRLEAEIQVSLVHPHIVGGRELLDVNGNPALVMEFVDGPTLGQLQAARAGLPVADKDRITRQVVDAVAFAHARGLVHRDLKPENVMVEQRQEGPVAKVTDFGIAKVVDQSSSTHTGVALGTPRYMSPEQIRDAKRVDARADVWSLGVLIYELHTGRSPFHRDVIIDVFTAIASGDYADPAEFGVAPQVRDAIRGALQVDPAARFADCGALLAALGAEPSVPPDMVPMPVARTAIHEDAPPVTVTTVSAARGTPPVITQRRPRPAVEVRVWPTIVLGWVFIVLLIIAVSLTSTVVIGGLVFVR